MPSWLEPSLVYYCYNIILSSMLWPSKFSSIWVFWPNICIYHSFHACYSPHPSFLDFNLNNIWWKIRIIKLLIVWFSLDYYQPVLKALAGTYIFMLFIFSKRTLQLLTKTLEYVLRHCLHDGKLKRKKLYWKRFWSSGVLCHVILWLYISVLVEYAACMFRVQQSRIPQ
jgi:hypothetical protein